MRARLCRPGLQAGRSLGRCANIAGLPPEPRMMCISCSHALCDARASSSKPHLLRLPQQVLQQRVAAAIGAESRHLRRQQRTEKEGGTKGFGVTGTSAACRMAGWQREQLAQRRLQSCTQHHASRPCCMIRRQELDRNMWRLHLLSEPCKPRRMRPAPTGMASGSYTGSLRANCARSIRLKMMVSSSRISVCSRAGGLR